MIRAAAHRAARRVGRRGAVLSLKGMMCALYGYSLLVQPPTDTRGIRLLLERAPLQVWGWLWVGAGALAMGCAWLRQGRDWLDCCVSNFIECSKDVADSMARKV